MITSVNLKKKKGLQAEVDMYDKKMLYKVHTYVDG